jgi:hypothetical protein
MGKLFDHSNCRFHDGLLDYLIRTSLFFKKKIEKCSTHFCLSHATHFVVMIFSFGDNCVHIFHLAGRIPFAFLEDIHGRFVKTYGRAALTALAYAMNDEFSRVLGQQMDYYSNDPNADRISRMRGEMDQVGSPLSSVFHISKLNFTSIQTFTVHSVHVN